MANSLEEQIKYIDRGLEWIKQHHPEHYENQYLNLIDERRKLKSILDVKNDNPAIAAYGVSQVGKSYLMNGMLQKGSKPFMVKGYNFVEDMNPITDNSEATGVVTRFTSFNRDKSMYNENYPIMMRTLSVADIIMIISDGYYNDISDYTTLGEEKINQVADEIYRKYKDNPENLTSPIQPDDVLEIKSYFDKFLHKANTFKHTSFFRKLTLVANKIPASDWADVFSILWANSEYQTKLFKKMLGTLARMKYSRYVYLTPQALLHEGRNENTVMSVQCLNQLFVPQPEHFTDVYLRDGDSFTKLADLTKSEVCAVCAEIILKIDNDYLEQEYSYYFGDIAPEVASKLPKDVFKTDILRNNDMLDFPGARSRLNLQQVTLREDANLIFTLLRGKVAYLFNKYDESKRINILLYCHHQEKNEVTEIPLLLKNWVSNNIGETMQKRRKTLELTHNISPLFYVGTKFNLDMRINPGENANTVNKLAGRWNQRFFRTLYTECFAAESTLDDDAEKLFINWTQQGEFFNNCYVLRDYKYSGPKGGNNLYENERKEGMELSAARMLMDRDHYLNLRDTFVQDTYVKKFFKDPALSWDVAASINNDGALYIIQNLTKIAGTMEQTREKLFDDVIEASVGKITEILKAYYVSDDTSELLKENLRKANGIFRELEFACEKSPEYFGHLIQSLQLTEAESFQELHRLIPELAQAVFGNDHIEDYELIRKRCANFAGCENENQKWDAFITAYRFTNRLEAEKYLRDKKIDPFKLFKTDTLKRQNSAIIADAVTNVWLSKISGLDLMKGYQGRGNIDDVTLGNLVNALVAAAQNINLPGIIQKEIADYVDVLKTSNINEALVADMIATTISDFVTDFGYRYLNSTQIETAERVLNEEHIPTNKWIGKVAKENYSEEELTALFSEILSSALRFTPAYDANFNTWLEYMYMAFVAHLNVPNFDRDANDALKEILSGIRFN